VLPCRHDLSFALLPDTFPTRQDGAWHDLERNGVIGVPEHGDRVAVGGGMLGQEDNAVARRLEKAGGPELNEVADVDQDGSRDERRRDPMRARGLDLEARDLVLEEKSKGAVIGVASRPHGFSMRLFIPLGIL